MTAEKFAVRLVDDTGNLLAWTAIYAEPRPQEGGASCPFWPTGPTTFIVETPGLASEMIISWCDLGISRKQQIAEPVQVEVGQQLTFAWFEPVWLVFAPYKGPIPTITEYQSIMISPPAGSLAGVA